VIRWAEAMLSSSEDVTIYCHSWLGFGIGICQGLLLAHGGYHETPEVPEASGPFVIFLPPGKRKPRSLIASGDEPYLVVMRGVDYPDAPEPFQTMVGFNPASGYSTPAGTALFTKVFAFGGAEGHDYRPYYVRFNQFLEPYADRVIADYRAKSRLSETGGSIGLLCHPCSENRN
jgi:hypothetical protein